MAETCPGNTVDEHAVRIVAALVALLAFLSLWAAAGWILAFLALDFFLRGWVNRQYSPLRWIAKAAVSALRLEPKPIYAPPKVFAARVGSVVTLAIVVARIAAPAVAPFLTLLLATLASLEATAGFCVACWIYPWVVRPHRAS